MRTRSTLTFTVVALLCFSALGQTQPGHSGIRKALTDEQQRVFLSKRDAGMPGDATFDSYCQLFYGATDVAIHTDDHEINNTMLRPYFPDFYTPTWKEIFDMIAFQTGSSWKYDPQRDYWVFSRPAAPRHFDLTMADGWTSKDMGFWIGYAPSNYPVGMDVYYLGSYSIDSKKPEDASALSAKVITYWSLEQARRIKRDVTVADMKPVTVVGVDALYFEAPSPRPGVIWRQWIFVKDGTAFFILSALEVNDKKSLSDVEAMIKSFHVKS